METHQIHILQDEFCAWCDTIVEGRRRRYCNTQCRKKATAWLRRGRNLREQRLRLEGEIVRWEDSKPNTQRTLAQVEDMIAGDAA